VSTNRTLVGVDLGGTLIRAAVATGPGTHGEVARHPTLPERGPSAVLDSIAAAVGEATAGSRCDGVAIGIPGPLDPNAGIVYSAPHLPGWGGLHAADELQRRLGCPVVVQNDARLAAMAEWTLGAGVGTQNFIFITVSTGVGGGLVIDGELYTGAAGTAGELGHVPVGMTGPACGQGHVGCLEGMASGTAIAARARQALQSGEPSNLPDAGALDARAVETAALAGDALARRLFDEAGRALGRAIGGFINVLSPEVIALGGGLLGAGDLLFTPMRAAIPEMAFAEPLARCRIMPAALGTDAGLVGATTWALRRLGGDPLR
jgi:glucokinase